ncbi:HVA22-like protein [Psidium guajava]|nr:HVA22-like protein [Psidium guajava]
MLGKFVTRCLLLVLGYAYPAFLCFKTVEKNRVQIEELRHWCQYWIIVALFTVLERIGDLGFIIYLWHPKTKGTGYVYETVFRPFMASHEREIDMKLVEWEARAWDFASFYWQNCWEFAHLAVSRAMQYLAARSRNFKSSPFKTKERRRSGSINRSMSGTPKSDSGEMNPNVQMEYVYVEDETKIGQQEVGDQEDASPAEEEDKTRASGHRLRRSHTTDRHID